MDGYTSHYIVGDATSQARNTAFLTQHLPWDMRGQAGKMALKRGAPSFI